jgi:predicted transcriptional regulator
MAYRFKNIQPTDSELEILQVLWENGPSTVRLVNDRLNEKRIVGYTTTLKIMQIMTAKGILTRRKKDRTHIYSPLLNENDTRSLMVDKLMHSAFGGSAGKLIMQALGNKKTSAEELKKIKEIIKDLEKKE